MVRERIAIFSNVLYIGYFWEKKLAGHLGKQYAGMPWSN